MIRLVRCRVSLAQKQLVADFLKEGDIVRVEVVETDEKGRVRLSMKALIDAPTAEAKAGSEADE